MIFAGTLSCVLCQQRTRRGVTIIEWQLAGQGAPCMAPYNGDNCELSIIGTHRVLGSAQYLSSSPRDCHHTALCALWPPLNRCSQLGPLSCIFCANKQASLLLPHVINPHYLSQLVSLSNRAPTMTTKSESRHLELVRLE